MSEMNQFQPEYNYHGNEETDLESEDQGGNEDSEEPDQGDNEDSEEPDQGGNSDDDLDK